MRVPLLFLGRIECRTAIALWDHHCMDDKAFTLWLPGNLYHQIECRKAKSLTAYILQPVEEKLARDREEQLRIGFASLADAALDEDAELWMQAQRTAMKNV